MQRHQSWLGYLKHRIKSLGASVIRRVHHRLSPVNRPSLLRGRSPDSETNELPPPLAAVPIPANESQRLEALRKYHVLDTLPEQSYNDLTTIAAQICGTPISLISLIDEDRQWFKSRYGIDAIETPRAHAFCAHAICQPDRVLVVPNALEDDRFVNNPLVTHSPNIRFYAGAPLVTSDGFTIGTICVIDHVPRQLTQQQLEALCALGRQTIAQLELGRKTSDLQQSQQSLQALNQELKKYLENLNQRNTDMINLGKMSDCLQTCLTIQEACDAIPRLLEPLFPGCVGYFSPLDTYQQNPGEISSREHCSCDCDLTRQSSSELSAQSWQGSELEKQCQTVDPCHQSIDYSQSVTLSIPVISQGKNLGILNFQEYVKNALSSNEKQLLARTVSEQIALAITNLSLREKLQNQSMRDPLTGLFNRRYLEESFEREIMRASRYHHSIGTIMLDMDHFKHINDTYGHDAGDYVLQMISKVLLENVRGSDIVCRYGGEEMVVILPELSLENTYERAEIIRLEIMQLQLQHKAQSLGPLTASLGVAVFPRHGVNSKDIIYAADTALYRAKKSGRNRVAIADS